MSAVEPTEYFILPCPHCGEDVQLFEQELACCIFRHGAFIGTNVQIPPHASRELIDTWLLPTKIIYGCGKPFRFNRETRSLEPCDYI